MRLHLLNITLKNLFAAMSFLLSFLVSFTGSIRCYCTDEHCVPHGICESAFCLVGLLRSNNKVVRTCGNDRVGCQSNVDKWSELCSCEESFCNTFSYLRASISEKKAEKSMRNEYGDEDQRVFQRVEGSQDISGYTTNDEDRITKKSTLLTLLLVIVPLSVGAATVMVVAFNYYCHLC